MNGKKPLMDYRRVQKLQTPLLLSGALLSGVGTSVSIPLVILGIAIMLFAIVIGVLYYRCPHCGRPLGRIGDSVAYCPHCGKALDAPVEEPVCSISVPAYAKLNLTLDILGKRDDGYHEMKMVMQTISLHDDVTVTLTDKGIACRVAGAELPCDERNLAVKAANAFCEAMDYRGGSAPQSPRLPRMSSVRLSSRYGRRQRGRSGGAARTARSCLPRAHGRAARADQCAYRQRRSLLHLRRHTARRGPR